MIVPWICAVAPSPSASWRKTPNTVEREFPGLLRHPLARKFMGLSLNQAVSMARGRVPQDSINRLLTELGEL